MPLFPAPSVVDTSQAPADRGFKAWTQPIYALSSQTALPTAGLLMMRRIRRVPATSVTNIVTFVNGAGSSLTSGQCFAALFTAAGALVGQTADQAVAWASVGIKTMALTGAPFALAAGDYYVGVWFNGTTGPSIVRHAAVNGGLSNAGLSAPNFETCTADTGLTTTAPPNFGAQTSAGTEYWYALS